MPFKFTLKKLIIFHVITVIIVIHGVIIYLPKPLCSSRKSSKTSSKGYKKILNKFMGLYQKLKRSQGFLFNYKIVYPHFRMPFPQEDLWMHEFLE